MKFIEFLIEHRSWLLSKEILALYGIEFPKSVSVGERLVIAHRGFGMVIHPSTIIGNDVRLYHGVTIGRSDAHKPNEFPDRPVVILEDNTVVYPGAVIIGGRETTVVGRGTIVGPNSVLNQSTGPNEVWGGVPARRLKIRNS